VALTLLRQDKEDTLKVTLSPRPETLRSRAARGSAGSAWLGIVGQTLTPQVAQAMRLSANQHGVLVEKVERGSPADSGRAARQRQDGLLRGTPRGGGGILSLPWTTNR